jgi:protein-disulfide isomerase
MATLASPVGARDHVQGPADAPVTMVEYGDYECGPCGAAHANVKAVQERLGDKLRFVFRHLPLEEAHPRAELAAEAAEAAGAQGKFWEMHDTMLAHQGDLTLRDILGYAQELGLDVDKFKAALRKRKGSGRIAEDVESADLSGVSGTPTFFINGHRHQDAYDIDTLTKAVRLARTRVSLNK